jgi:hypothetical protein
VKKWTKVAAGAALVMLMVIEVTAWRSPSREPVYKGRRLGEYLYHFGVSGESTDDDLEAFIEFGTNGVPFVRRALQVRDTPSRKIAVWLAVKIPWLKLRVHSASETHLAALYAYDGILQAIDEGRGEPSGAEACASEIHSLLKDPDPFVRFRANIVLEGIGGVKAHAQDDAVFLRLISHQ